MLNRYIQAADQSNSLTTQFWQEFSQQINGLESAPAHVTLKQSNWADINPFDKPIEVYHYFIDISLNKQRLMYCYNILDPDTLDQTTCIAVYGIQDTALSKETEFRFKNLDIEYETENESDLSNLRQVQFMGNNHIAMGLATGHIRILSIPDNEIYLEEKIGGLVSTLTCSNKYLAASLFPGIKEKFYFACGVKVYKIKDIIEHKRFDTCYVLPGEHFSILPHSLRIHPSNDRILCKGSKILSEGYINYIEEYSLKTDKLTTVLEQEDKNINQRISNYSAAGEYCAVSKEKFVVNNTRHKKVWQPVLPEILIKEKIKNCKLSEDGSRIIIFKKGVLYLLQKGKPEAKVMNNLGYVNWAHFISPSQIIVSLSKFYYIDMIILNTEDLTVHSRLNVNGFLETINPDGYTFSGKGDLLIADSKGIIRKFNSDMISQSDIHHPYGPVRQLKYDPIPNKNVILSESGAVIIYDSDTDSMHLKIGKNCGTEIVPGSGYRCIHMSETVQNKADGVWMCENIYTKCLEFSNNRYLEIKLGNRKTDFFDSIDGSFVNIAKMKHPVKVIDTCNFNDKLLILLENGKIIKINPHDTQNLVKKTFPIIVDSIESPRGVSKIGNNHIVIWTKAAMHWVEVINNKGRIQVSKNVAGVKQIKWDKVKQRLAVAFDTHIAFYTQNLIEMYRLYILRDNDYLIHVLFPEELDSDDTRNHPGYFWSQRGCLHLFDVIDHGDKPITHDQKRNNFLSQYINRTLVETAVKDYENFNRIVAGSKVGLPANLNMLLIDN